MLTALCLVLLPMVMTTPSPQVGGIISGRLLTQVTEAPVAGATIRVVGDQTGQGVAVQSDSLGRFVLRGVPLGIATIEVRRVGFTPVRRGDIVVTPAKPAEVTIVLQAISESAGQQLAQVTVRPDAFPLWRPPSTPVSTQRYDAEEVRRQPGAQEDVLRAISIAPGVGVTSAARNDLIVRGGAPFENRFVVDQLEVPNINHFGSQGSTGGPLSLINIRFVESASISAGGFGARYGDRVSSLTDITLREGNRERVTGEVNVAATQVGAVLEGPLAEKTSFLANVRQSYLDLLFKALGLSFIPSYTDATVKTVWRPNARHSISAFAIGARGTVAFNNTSDSARVDNARILAPVQDQVFGAVTYKRLLSRGVATTTLGRTWTRYRTEQRDSLLRPVFTSRSVEAINTLRSDWIWRTSNGTEVEVGAQLEHAPNLTYAVALDGRLRRDENGVARPLASDTTFSTLRQGAHVQVSTLVHPSLRVSAGLREDWYTYLDQAVRLAPRVSLAWNAAPATTLTLAVGRYWQAPSAIWLVGDTANATRLVPMRADHVVAGASRLIGRESKLQIEWYYKKYRDYPARLFRSMAVLAPSGYDDVTTDIPFGLEPLASSGLGHATGVELFAQKKLGVTPWYGQMALGLSRTRFSGLDGTERVGAFDTPVTANGVVGWRPNARWELATRVRAASGLPYTPRATTGSAAGTLDYSRYLEERLPTFLAIDVRADRRFLVRQRQLVMYVDLQNLTNRENVGVPRWNPRLQRTESNTGVGLLPTIGLNLEF